MLIKRLDFLSPPVTFYHKGFLSHSSIVSGIISIISMIIILSLTIYFSLEIIQKKKPNAFSYNSFIEDAGIFPINSSSLFHFISMAPAYSESVIEGIDFTNFRIIGFDVYYEYYLAYKNLSLLNHWLYGFCNNESDTKGISHLVNYDYFEKSACIKKYFIAEDQKYYDIGDPKFKWPEIAHGTYQKNYSIYNVIIERCKEDTIDLILGEGHHCRNSLDFEELFKNYSMYGVAYFYFINHYINILNYENPNKKFFYTIEGILSKNEYTSNHVNFNPSLIKTHNGLIFDNIKEIRAHIFERNEVFTSKREGNDIFSVYIFWLKNVMNYHERAYKRIQDIISNIGGIYQFVVVMATFINTSFNNYIVLSDTEILLTSNIYREKTIDKNNEIERQNLKKLKELKKEKTRNNIHKNSNRNKIKNEKPHNKIEKNKNENNNSKSYNNCITSYENINVSKVLFDKNDNKDNQNIKNKNNKNSKNKTFCNFLLYKLTCGKKNSYYNVYIDFRKKMISEEHLIKNHLNIYNLLRATEKKRFHLRNSYKLNNLINLI